MAEELKKLLILLRDTFDVEFTEQFPSSREDEKKTPANSIYTQINEIITFKEDFTYKEINGKFVWESIISSMQKTFLELYNPIMNRLKEIKAMSAWYPKRKQDWLSHLKVFGYILDHLFRYKTDECPMAESIIRFYNFYDSNTTMAHQIYPYIQLTNILIQGLMKLCQDTRVVTALIFPNSLHQDHAFKISKLDKLDDMEKTLESLNKRLNDIEFNYKERFPPVDTMELEEGAPEA